MLDLHPAVLNAFIALVGVLLLVYAWRAVASLPAVARWTLRVILTAVIIAPFALLVMQSTQQSGRAPGDHQIAEQRSGEEGADSAPASKPSKKYARRKYAPESAGSAPEESTGSEYGGGNSAPPPEPEMAAPKPAAPSQPPAAANGHEKMSSARDDEAAPAAPASVPRDGLSSAERNGSGTRGGLSGFGTSGPGPGGGGTGEGTIGVGSGASRGLGSGGRVDRAREAAPPVEAARRAPESSAPAEAAAPAPEEDWTVVPVYYGTDRARVPNDKRVDYGSDRGRRLELGRAMVSVPKAHQVPQVERPWAITIPYFNYKIYEEKEDPKKHFIMQEIKDYTQAELLALVKERLMKSARFKDHAFVFVHGYNTSFDFAVYRAAQIAYDIKFDGAPFVYSWPSGGGIASYTYDRESSAQAEPYFTDFLKMVTQKTGAKHVSVIAHSMGNQLLLRVLQDLQRTKPEGVSISQIIFAAPDVDRDAFETIAMQLKDFATGGITLYAASNDRALNVSRRFYGGVPRAGDVPATGPLIVPGIDTIDATAVSMDSLGLHHSGYAESNALLQDIGLLIQTGERPPGKRVPILQEVKTDRGEYWRYPGGP